MVLLIGVILLGTIIMINLIVAIIITDIERLNRISKQQVLRNQVGGVCTQCAVFDLLSIAGSPRSANRGSEGPGEVFVQQGSAGQSSDQQWEVNMSVATRVFTFTTKNWRPSGQIHIPRCSLCKYIDMSNFTCNQKKW